QGAIGPRLEAAPHADHDQDQEGQADADADQAPDQELLPTTRRPPDAASRTFRLVRDDPLVLFLIEECPRQEHEHRGGGAAARPFYFGAQGSSRERLMWGGRLQPRSGGEAGLHKTGRDRPVPNQEWPWSVSKSWADSGSRNGSEAADSAPSTGPGTNGCSDQSPSRGSIAGTAPRGAPGRT